MHMWSEMAGTGDLVEVILEGGRDGITRTARIDRQTASGDIIKIQRLAGYDHFERVAEPTDGPAPVFRWTHWTAIAE